VSDGEDRAAGPAHDLLCDPAHEQPAQARAAVRPEDDQVRANLVGHPEDFVAGESENSSRYCGAGSTPETTR
jgi:hypothetical protein